MLNGRVLISMRAFIWYSLSKRTQKRLLANLNIGKQEAMNKARCLSHRLKSNCKRFQLFVFHVSVTVTMQLKGNVKNALCLYQVLSLKTVSVKRES